MFKGLDNRMRIVYGNLYDPDKEDAAMNWSECLLDEFEDDPNISLINPGNSCVIVLTLDGVNLALFSDNSFFFIGQDIFFKEKLSCVKIDMDYELLEPQFCYTFMVEDDQYTLFMNFKSLVYKTFTNRMLPSSPRKIVNLFRVDSTQNTNLTSSIMDIWKYQYEVCNYYSGRKAIWLDCDTIIFSVQDYKGIWICTNDSIIFLGRQEIFDQNTFMTIKPIDETNKSSYVVEVADIDGSVIYPINVLPVSVD